MTFETRDEILEEVMAETLPLCPYCGSEMSIWEVPMFQFEDGLGWGTPYLFVCFNDDCPPYVEGWAEIKKNYGHTASVRCYCYPGTQQYELMPVFSPAAAKGLIIDDEVIAKRNTMKEAIKKGFSTLADCYVQKDAATVLEMLMDHSEPVKVRLKAAEMIGDIGEGAAVEPLRNKKFANRLVQKKVDRSIMKLHRRFATRECPYCAEIIKRKAVVCRHCGRPLA